MSPTISQSHRQAGRPIGSGRDQAKKSTYSSGAAAVKSRQYTQSMNDSEKTEHRKKAAVRMAQMRARKAREKSPTYQQMSEQEKKAELDRVNQRVKAEQ